MSTATNVCPILPWEILRCLICRLALQGKYDPNTMEMKGNGFYMPRKQAKEKMKGSKEGVILWTGSFVPCSVHLRTLTRYGYQCKHFWDGKSMIKTIYFPSRVSRRYLKVPEDTTGGVWL